MDRGAESGLEVIPSTGPEVVPQPHGYMYYMGGGASNDTVFDQPNQSDQSCQLQTKKPGRSRAFRVLAGIAVVCLSVAIGAGLGAGLTAQHKSTLSLSSSGKPITTIQTNSTPVTTTQSANLMTITPTPVKPPSSTCPAANGSTYVATNKPLETIGPTGTWQITNESLSFEIFCNTNFVGESPVIDLQVMENISSLNDCLDQCALYDFHMIALHFPALGCTGIAWDGEPYNLCWLKSNVKLGSPNGTAHFSDADGAVLLGLCSSQILCIVIVSL